ncbi:hypothetical protein NKH77_53890 [Streptomyces sp. M19]
MTPQDGGAARTRTPLPPVDLPTYPFRAERLWPEPRADAGGDVTGAGLRPVGHPAGRGRPGRGRRGTAVHGAALPPHPPWLEHHAVYDVVLLPGTAFVDIAAEAGRQTGCGTVEELTIEAPLAVAADAAVDLQTAVGDPDGTGRRPVTVYARPPTRTPTTPGPGTPSEPSRPRPRRRPTPRTTRSGPGRCHARRHRRPVRAAGRARLRLRARLPGPARRLAPRPDRLRRGRVRRGRAARHRALRRAPGPAGRGLPRPADLAHRDRPGTDTDTGTGADGTGGEQGRAWLPFAWSGCGSTRPAPPAHCASPSNRWSGAPSA